MYFAHPIPATYASLYYLSLGVDAFLLSVIGFTVSIAIAFVSPLVPLLLLAVVAVLLAMLAACKVSELTVKEV